MAIAKITLNGVTQMDVTQKTVTSESMLPGITALKNDGTDITGSIAPKTSSDLTAFGASVTAPAGYYASAATKSVASGSATTPATTITANPSISVSSGGLITATTSATKSVTPSVSAGFVSSGTAGTITVSGSNTEQLSTQAAQTIHPSTTDQTIASGKYITGTQTIAGVLLTNLTSANIVSGVTVKVGDANDDDCVASVVGTASIDPTPLAYQYTSDFTPSWTSGAINESTGGNVVSPYYIRTSYYGWDDQSLGGLEIIVPTGYQLRIAIYTTSGGVSGFIKFLDSALWNGTRFFLPQGYMFRAMLRYDTTPETEISTSAGSAVTFKKFAA